MKKARALVKSQQYLEWAEKAEDKSTSIHDSFFGEYGEFLALGEPVKIGHHSEGKHRRLLERRDSTMCKVVELSNKAKRMREKSANLLAFANRNKGDAERKRQEEREAADKVLTVGSQAFSWIVGQCEIIKVNKKTYTVKMPSGSTFTQDKSYFKL